MEKKNTLCDDLVNIDTQKGYWTVNISGARDIMESLARKVVDILGISI